MTLAAHAAGDPKRGAQAFRQCMACHSVAAGEQMTGPSLAHIWNRKAGSVEAGAQPGDEAPAFSLPDEDGKIVSNKARLRTPKPMRNIFVAAIRWAGTFITRSRAKTSTKRSNVFSARLI